MQVRQLITKIIRAVVLRIAAWRTGLYLLSEVLYASLDRVRKVNHGGVRLKFAAPNLLCDWRAVTFSEKEPETLEWIDSMPEGVVLWDIGANVGIYSVYAALKRNCRVYAFEPSVFNLEILARNIFLNDLTEKVCIVPLALSDRLAAAHLRMTSTQWGGALSTFGREFGWDGEPMRETFQYRTLGLTMEDAIAKLGIARPDYIKMDVDGLEHLILKGGISVLSSIKGILVEVNDDFHEQADGCASFLREAGLVLQEKRHSEMVSGVDSAFRHCFNQIWVRP